MPERWVLVLATAVLALGAIAIWTAALMPQFFPVWRRAGDPLAVVAGHAALWRVNAVLFTVSAVAALVGCGLAFRPTSSPLVAPSLSVLAVATALWVANNCLRMTAVADVAVERTEAGEAWLALAERWTGAMWLVASALVLLAFAGLGIAALGSGALGPWIGWVLVGSAVLSLGFLVVLRDVPPVVAYLPLLPLAVATGIAATR